MAKFNKGDKVRVFTGYHAGETGVVVNPWYQPSQSDWPCVILVREDGNRFSAHHDEMELTEDPSYEYAVQTIEDTGRVHPPNGFDWIRAQALEEAAEVVHSREVGLNTPEAVEKRGVIQRHDRNDFARWLVERAEEERGSGGRD